VTWTGRDIEGIRQRNLVLKLWGLDMILTHNSIETSDLWFGQDETDGIITFCVVAELFLNAIKITPTKFLESIFEVDVDINSDFDVKDIVAEREDMIVEDRRHCIVRCAVVNAFAMLVGGGGVLVALNL
jgi:hypothetical protein